MKTEYIQSLLAIILVGALFAFFFNSPTNRTLYVAFPLKIDLKKDTGMKVIQGISDLKYQIINNPKSTSCIHITRQTTNAICLSRNAIRIESLFTDKGLTKLDHEFRPNGESASKKLENLKVLVEDLKNILSQAGMPHHEPEYTW